MSTNSKGILGVGPCTTENPVCFCIPPYQIAHGWISFIFSLIFISGIAYIVTKLTNVISCVTGIDSYVIAFTALAVGTLWPDLMASKIAVERQITADSAIAIITCRLQAKTLLEPWVQLLEAEQKIGRLVSSQIDTWLLILNIRVRRCFIHCHHVLYQVLLKGPRLLYLMIVGMALLLEQIQVAKLFSSRDAKISIPSLFSPSLVISLDEWVFNTEAHPIKIVTRHDHVDKSGMSDEDYSETRSRARREGRFHGNL